MITNGVEGLDWKQELHDLSQPVTRLQWRLDLAQFSTGEVELREVIAGAQADIVDVLECMRQIRVRAEGQQDVAGRAA